MARTTLNREKRISVSPVVGLLGAFLIALGVIHVVGSLPWESSVSAQEVASRLPKPVDVSLTTREKDGESTTLSATYYRSSAGANAPVVLLLHMHGRDRKDWTGFAEILQKADFAVLNLDLRGHGESKLTREGDDVEVAPEQLRRNDYERMYYDMEAAKRFLIEKNNARELNIEKFGVVAAEMSTAVAVAWAQLDWEWEALPGLGKQGKDVKALVLLTPQWNYQGIDIRRTLPLLGEHEEVAILFIAGQKDKRSMRDAERMSKVVRGKDRENIKGLGYDTDLNGTRMLEKGLAIEEDILEFLNEHLKSISEPWADRSVSVGKRP